MSASKRKERAEEKRIKKLEAKECEYNLIRKPTNVLFNFILTILSLLSLIPFLFVIIISLTDEESLAMNGYRFIPEKWSLHAYQYIIDAGESIIRSYGVTILVTVVGTLLGLFLIGTYSYALSRRTYAFRSFFTKVITVPMLFSGGMIANYLIVTKVLMLKNSVWALILPLAMNSFNIIVMRTFFKMLIYYISFSPSSQTIFARKAKFFRAVGQTMKKVRKNCLAIPVFCRGERPRSVFVRFLLANFAGLLYN